MADCSRRPCSRLSLLYLLLLIVLLGASGCGPFAAPSGDDGPVTIRTPKPTFTPTPAAPQVVATPLVQATPQAPAGEQAASGGPAAAPASGSAKAVVNGPLVNVRSGPSTDFDIVATVERGAEYDIVGVNPDRSWWQICCVDGAQAWIIGEFVDTLGPVDSVDVVGGAPQVAEAAPQPADPPAPVTPTTAPQPTANFVLKTQEQFPETSHVRIFLYVYSGQSALEGYKLRVTKDDQQLPVDGLSFGGQPAFTWPFADARQRFQNFKVEYPDVAAAGQWVLQLVDANDTPVGPPATFTLSSDDPQQELYVRYERQ